jgi:catechol 2,3-dioxygenase-like lactoylglutathione lyase family enzyme
MSLSYAKFYLQNKFGMVSWDSMPDNDIGLIDIHHVGLTVSSIEDSVRFYRDILGLSLIGRREAAAEYISQQTGYPGVRLSVASFQTGPGGRLELVQYLNHSGGASDTATNRSGNSHLCFKVIDLSRLHARLLEQGVRFRSSPVVITSGPNQGGMVVYLYDPDNYVIELFQPTGRQANQA